MSDWWKSLTLSEKKDYLKQHPRSKKKISGNKSASNKGIVSSKEDQPRRKLSSSERERAVRYLNANGYTVKQAFSGSLDDMQRSFERKIERLENKDVKKLYDKTVTAVKLDADKASSNVKQLLSVSGIVLLASVALSVAVGADVTSTASLIVGSFGDDIKRHTMEVTEELKAIEQEEARTDFENDQERDRHRAEMAERRRRAKIEYLKRVHEDMMKKAKENLDDPDKIVDSLRKTDSLDTTQSIATQPAETSFHNIVKSVLRSTNIKTIPMKEKITINSSHETDLLKALIKLEKADVSSKEDDSHESLLTHIDYLESCIPTAATIMVASIGKPTILTRAKYMLNKCNEELAITKTRLNRVAETASMKKSSLDFFLKKNLKPKEYKFEKAYVQDGDEIKVCEHHILSGVETSSYIHNKIEIYSFMTGNTINLSLVKDSNFMPKSFSSIKPRELSSWLKEHI